MKNPFTRARRLRAERDEAREAARMYRRQRNDADAGAVNALRKLNECLRAYIARGEALDEIVASVDSIKTPNGTLRKVRRIAVNGAAKTI